MVITTKSNGEPMRSVDYQQLNKYMQRQTFPMETPFQWASRIPPMSKKTVVDSWNVFHSVSLHHERMDGIFAEFSDKVRCVDDAAM